VISRNPQSAIRYDLLSVRLAGNREVQR